MSKKSNLISKDVQSKILNGEITFQEWVAATQLKEQQQAERQKAYAERKARFDNAQAVREESHIDRLDVSFRELTMCGFIIKLHSVMPDKESSPEYFGKFDWFSQAGIYKLAGGYAYVSANKNRSWEQTIRPLNDAGELIVMGIEEELLDDNSRLNNIRKALKA